MSVITLPANLYVSSMTWGQQRNDIEYRSAFGSQAVEISPPLWTVSMEVDRIPEDQAGYWKAVQMQLGGRTNQLAVYDMGRPQPLGTLRGTPVLKTGIAAGVRSMTINGGYDAAGCTLLTGDMLGFGSGLTQQVVMVTADATADPEPRGLGLDFLAGTYLSNVPGDITVSFEPATRNSFSAGTSIVWDKPTILCRRSDSKASWDYKNVFTSGMQLELIEDVRP